MQSNQTFLRMRMLDSFLKKVAAHKQGLMNDLVKHATQPVVVMRRYRMLSQLCDYESQIIQKIYNLETDDPLDFLKTTYEEEIVKIVNANS